MKYFESKGVGGGGGGDREYAERRIPAPLEVVADRSCDSLRDTITAALDEVVADGRRVSLRWEDLSAALRKTPPQVPAVPVVLLGGMTPSVALPESLLAGLRALDPTLGLFVCVATPAERDARIVRFMGGGADDVVAVAGGRAALRSVVAGRLLAPPVGPLVRRFAEIYGGLPNYLEAAFIVRNPHMGLSVDQVARRFGIHKATLYEHFDRLELPPPARLARWACMEQVAELQETSHFKQETIAWRVRRPGAAALRAARRRIQRTEEHDVRLRSLHWRLACEVDETAT